MHRKGLIDSNNQIPFKQEKEQQATLSLTNSQTPTTKKFAVTFQFLSCILILEAK
jgi:hypothetical protein